MKTYAHLSVEDLTNEMNERVFGIKELTPTEKNEIKNLKQTMAKTLRIIIASENTTTIKERVDILKELETIAEQVEAQVKEKN